MLVMICTKYRKNPLTTVAHSINKFVANLITSTTRVLKHIYLKVSNLTAPPPPPPKKKKKDQADFSGPEIILIGYD